MLSCFQTPKEIACFYCPLYNASFFSAHFAVLLLKWTSSSSTFRSVSSLLLAIPYLSIASDTRGSVSTLPYLQYSKFIKS